MNALPVVGTQTIPQEDFLEIAIDEFLVARKVENLSRASLRFYRVNLEAFAGWCDTQSVKTVSQIDANLLRQFFLYLEGEGHNPGGMAVYYRAIRAFMRWYWLEHEIGSKNPIDKVKSPKVPQEPIQGVTDKQFSTLLDACGNSKIGERDRAILMILLDTGIRAQELCNIRMEDLSLSDNSVLIVQGKGRKPRYVFFGATTRKQIKKHLRLRGGSHEWLFAGRSGEKLDYSGLRQMLRRLDERTGLKVSLHDFRRGYCLRSLQAGVDIQSLARLMGHSSITLIARYAKQSSTDLHAKYVSPVERRE